MKKFYEKSKVSEENQPSSFELLANEKHIFLSYNHQNRKKVYAFADILIEEGYSVWIDRENMVPSEKIFAQTCWAIDNASLFICFISNKYISSNNCRMEFFYAHRKDSSFLYVILEKLDDNTAGINLYLRGGSLTFNAYKYPTDDNAGRIIYDHLKDTLANRVKPAYKNLASTTLATMTTELNPNIFISYCHIDKVIVNCFADKLTRLNHSFWMDNKQLIGDDIASVIENAINKCTIMLCFISEQYMTSGYCRREFFYGHYKRKKFVFIMLEKLLKNIENGMTMYLNDQSMITIDAYKFFNFNIHQFVEEIYTNLKPSITVISA